MVSELKDSDAAVLGASALGWELERASLSDPSDENK